MRKKPNNVKNIYNYSRGISNFSINSYIVGRDSYSHLSFDKYLYR